MELLDRLAGSNDSTVLFRTQGSVDALRTLRSLFASAPSAVEKLKSR